MGTPGFSLKFNRLQAVSDLGFSGSTMVRKRWAFCREPTWNFDLFPGRVMRGTILCPHGGQLPVSHAIARVNNRHTHCRHSLLKTAAPFSLSVHQQTTELSTVKNARDTPNPLAPTVAQMVQNLPTMLV